MPASIDVNDPGQLIRLLLQAIQRNDREAVILHLVEIGLWLTVTSGPLPPPKVATVSAAALTISVNELRSFVQQHRDMAAKLEDRDSSSLAAVIDRNAEMIESVVSALNTLTGNTGFLMVEN